MQVFYCGVLQLVLTSGGFGDVPGPKVTVPELLSQGSCPGTKPPAKATACMAVQQYLGSQGTVQWDTREPWGRRGDLCAMWGCLAIVVSTLGRVGTGVGWVGSDSCWFAWEVARKLQPTQAIPPTPLKWRRQRKLKLPFTFPMGVPKSGKAKSFNLFSASLLLSDFSIWQIIWCTAKVTWCAHLIYCVCSLWEKWWKWRWTGGRAWLTFEDEKKVEVTTGAKICLKNAWGFGRSLLQISA